jgi:hypothetical protein
VSTARRSGGRGSATASLGAAVGTEGDARRGLIVELAGLRGVGKSTLLPVVAEELHRRDIGVGRPPLPASAKLGVVLRALGPRLTVRWRLRPWPPWSAASRRFDQRLTRYLHRVLRARGHPGVHLIDGGIGQLLMTVHTRGARADPLTQWDRLTDLLPLPDVIVLLTASERAIESRREARGTVEDRRTPRPAPHEHAALHSLEAYLARGAPHGRVDFVHVTADDELGRLGRSVADEIERRYVS